MADPQPSYSFAIAIEIIGPVTFRGATTDLPEAAAVASLGAFYRKFIISTEPVKEELPHIYYGLASPQTWSFVASNTVGNEEHFNVPGDWREAPVRA